MYTNNIEGERMDNLTFIKNISERINKYKYIYKLGSSQRYYFRIDQISYSKEWKEGATPHNEEYYVLVEKTLVTLTNHPEKLFNFIEKNFGQLPITFSTPTFIPGKSLYIGLIKEETDTQNIPTIEDYFKIEKENEKKKIIECLKKQLKLNEKDKINFVFIVEENKPAGNLEETSGEAIISNKIYTPFWLKYNEKKRYYLDYINPIKIIDLDKTK